jgi:hypothetical protein
MAAKKIVVELDEETAEFSVDLTGFQGQGCADITKAFGEIGSVVKDIKKPEYKSTTCNLQRK